jgi:hypothetical protein
MGIGPNRGREQAVFLLATSGTRTFSRAQFGMCSLTNRVIFFGVFSTRVILAMDNRAGAERAFEGGREPAAFV